MTMYRGGVNYPVPDPQPTPAQLVNAGRLWSGGLAAALVAAGVAVVGYLAIRGVLEIPILGKSLSGQIEYPSMFTYAGCAALAGVLATGTMHLLLLGTPRPRSFFVWIIALATIASMLVPLALPQPLDSRIATAMLNLAIGVAIGALVNMSAAASIRWQPGTTGTTL